MYIYFLIYVCIYRNVLKIKSPCFVAVGSVAVSLRFYQMVKIFKLI